MLYFKSSNVAGVRRLVKFDPETTGQSVRRRRRPRVRATATPMTCRTGTGRQSVLVATRSGASQELVAFATP